MSLNSMIISAESGVYEIIMFVTDYQCSISFYWCAAFKMTATILFVSNSLLYRSSGFLKVQTLRECCFLSLIEVDHLGILIVKCAKEFVVVTFSYPNNF